MNTVYRDVKEINSNKHVALPKEIITCNMKHFLHTKRTLCKLHYVVLLRIRWYLRVEANACRVGVDGRLKVTGLEELTAKRQPHENHDLMQPASTLYMWRRDGVHCMNL